EHLAPVHGHPERPAQESLRSGRAQADDHLRADGIELGVEPGTAGGDLAEIRLAVDPPLALGHPGEVLDDVGEEDAEAVEAGLSERLVEEPAGGPDERPPGLVLLVPRLLPDQEHLGLLWPLAEHGLGSPGP